MLRRLLRRRRVVASCDDDETGRLKCGRGFHSLKSVMLLSHPPLAACGGFDARCSINCPFRSSARSEQSS